MSKSVIVFLCMFIFASTSFAGPTGVWSDNQGNNYYGSPPSSSSTTNNTNNNTTTTTTTNTQTQNNQQNIYQQSLQIEAEKVDKEKDRRGTLKSELNNKKKKHEQAQAEKKLKIKKQEELAKQKQELIKQKQELKKNEFKQSKKEALSLLKKGNSPKLRLQEDYYKTLKVGDVPLRTDSGRKITKKELRQEEIDKLSKDMHKKKESLGEANRKSRSWVGKKKKELIDWVHLRAFDETFNRIPIVSGLRSFCKKTGSWSKSMKELVVGVYENGMGNFQRGVGELGSDKVYLGTGDNGVDEMGNKARERAGKMAASEIEGKAGF